LSPTGTCTWLCTDGIWGVLLPDCGVGFSCAPPAPGCSEGATTSTACT
jgi:hypothetical protein